MRLLQSHKNSLPEDLISLVYNPRKTVFASRASDLFLDPLNTCSWTSFNYHLVWATTCSYLLCFPDGLKLFPAARLMPSMEQKLLCFPLGVYLP